MKNVENIDTLTKEEEIERIQEIKSKLLSDDSKIEGIFNSHLLNFDFSKKYSPYELEMKNIKKVLIDLSILLGYDLEPCHDIITAKHYNIKGITYPIFKGCIIDFLEKKELKLQNMFFQEQNSVPIGQIQNGNDMVNNKDKIKENISLTDDINLIILHRSLYILKKKFDKYSSQIKKIYSKYCEPIESEEDYLIETNNIKPIIEEICNLAQFEIARCDTFQDAINKEMNYFKKCENEKQILNEFLNFVFNQRRKYNFIFREKRNKKDFKLHDYEDYIPIGDDDLTRKVVETLKDDNEIIGNNIKDKDNKSEILINDHNFNISLKNENLEEEKEEEDKKEEEKKEKKKEKEINLENENNIDKSKLSQAISKNDSNNEQEEEEENDEVKSKLEIEDIIKKNNPKISNKLRKLSLKSQMNKSVKEVSYVKTYLYIETLPLMIADFISKEKRLLLLDHSDELRDNLRTLFDNEIMARLGEETYNEITKIKSNQLKELLLNLAKIEKNISCYQDIYTKMKNSNQNVKYIINTIEKLNSTKEWLNTKIKAIQDDTNTYNEYENTIKNAHSKMNLKIKTPDEKSVISSKKNKTISINENKSEKQSHHSINNTINNENYDKKSHNSNLNDDNSQNQSHISLPKIEKSIINSSKYSNSNNTKLKNKKIMSKEEKRELAIREIFYFYSRQHALIGYKSTFDNLKDKLEHMDLSEFSKFCSDFKILASNEKLVEIFKKTASITKEMNIDEFKIALQKISVAINDEKIKLVKKKVIKLKNELNLKKNNNENNMKDNSNVKNNENNNKNNNNDNDNNDNKSKKNENINENENNENDNKENKTENNDNNTIKSNNKTEKNDNQTINSDNKTEKNDNNTIKSNNKTEKNDNNTIKSNNKTEKNDNNNSIKKPINENIKGISMLKKDHLEGEIFQYQNDIKSLKNKKTEELLEELYLYLEIDNEEYKKKMKGFYPPFGSNKNEKIILPKINVGKPKKINIKQELEQLEIKEIINQRKENKLKNAKQQIRITGLDRELQKINLEKNNKIFFSNHNNKNIKNYNLKQSIIQSSKRPILLYPKDRDEVIKEENRLRKFRKNKSPEPAVSRFDIVKVKNDNEINYSNNPKRENKFNWESIENMKTNNFINDDELLKIING